MTGVPRGISRYSHYVFQWLSAADLIGREAGRPIANVAVVRDSNPFRVGTSVYLSL